ncbi:MAG: hypothetical protein A2X77_02260 [Gammaproteobacteria bacterium GWE2_42_36]|nr:MAG: hypothetical protein A2X77_02260 [Gammaproteobacteria bacterium GWE2_42_36]
MGGGNRREGTEPGRGDSTEFEQGESLIVGVGKEEQTASAVGVGLKEGSAKLISALNVGVLVTCRSVVVGKPVDVGCV